MFGRSNGAVRAVDDVSFTIRRGETLGLVGESGSGKTTIGRTLLRAIEPTAGEVIFQSSDGIRTDVTRLPGNELRRFRRHMQMIFQDPYASLNPRLTVRDIIAEPAIIAGGRTRNQIDELVQQIALRCKLNLEHLRRFPHAFSGGQRQRIGIARALVLNPEFLVCDEAVSALDVSVQAGVINLLQDLQAELKLTYLFIAHDLSVVEHISDRVAVLYLGRLAELAPTAELFKRPLHPYAEALLSAIPEADPDQPMRTVFLAGEIPNPANPPSGCSFHPRCRYVQEICKQQVPEWREHQPGRFAACHFAAELSLQGATI
ncbi:MAG: ATP-binding cassette domain-containing protein [Oscillochloris sp.]|nr:ATP-binding cassette domain-containing protein [Oscillochloris sp.]